MGGHDRGPDAGPDAGWMFKADERLVALQGPTPIAFVTADEKFAPLTYPRFALCLAQPEANCVAVGAIAGLRPIGLALASCGSSFPSRLLSLNVESDWRQRGIGSAMLATCESELATRGARLVMAIHSSRTVLRAAFERTLAAAAWEPTDHVGWRVTGACGSMLEAVTAWPALRKLLNAKHYAFPPWREMKADDTAALDRLCGQPACRALPVLAPARWPDPVEPVTSVVVRRNDVLVGWVISQRQTVPAGSPPAIHYVSAYLDRELWHTGIMIAAYHHAFSRQADAFGPESLAKFETPASMDGMCRLVQRRFAPLALSADQVFCTWKRIRGQAAA